MEKLRIGDVEHEIISIEYARENVLKIAFLSEIPTLVDSMDLLTEGGEICATFTHYTTVLKTIDHTVWVSDGNVVAVESDDNNIHVIDADVAGMFATVHEEFARIEEAMIGMYEVTDV